MKATPARDMTKFLMVAIGCGLCFLIGMLLAVSVYAQTTYSTQCLEIPPNYPYFGVFRVNNRGQVLGAVGFPDECGNGFGAELRVARWEPNGAIKIVEPLPPNGTLPECISTAFLGSAAEFSAMDNLGQIVTTDLNMWDPNGNVYTAIYWDDISQTVDMNSLVMGATNYRLQYPVGINDAGVIIGFGGSGPYGNPVSPFQLANGIVTTLPLNPFAINNSGVILGSTGSELAFWDGSALTPTGVSSANLYLVHENDAGHFVFASNPSGFWNGSSVVAPPPQSTAWGLNNYDQVLISVPISPYGQSASLWSPTQSGQSLTALPAGQMFDINDSGVIAANYSPTCSGPAILTPSYQGATTAGTYVPVSTDRAILSFASVSTPGTTSLAPIDPSTISSTPGGFAISGSFAYELSTTATYSGPVLIGFLIPSSIGQTDFASLRILHNENGTLVDVTTDAPPRNFSTHTIYASVTSFSPFYAVRTGTHINALFDQTKAYKSGSTVPVKFQVLDGNGNNVSASTLQVTTRQLKYLGADTTAAVVDSGNANPDYQFRYDASLGGYIFNLSTKGLASGRYGLSFYVGAERSFFYSVSFQVK